MADNTEISENGNLSHEISALIDQRLTAAGNLPLNHISELLVEIEDLKKDYNMHSKSQSP